MVLRRTDGHTGEVDGKSIFPVRYPEFCRRMDIVIAKVRLYQPDHFEKNQENENSETVNNKFLKNTKTRLQNEILALFFVYLYRYNKKMGVQISTGKKLLRVFVLAIQSRLGANRKKNPTVSKTGQCCTSICVIYIFQFTS